MDIAADIFEKTMTWLGNNYGNYKFFTERDIVWTVQTSIIKIIETKKLPYRIFQEFPILYSNSKRSYTDLAILDKKDMVKVAIEFKYESSHKRNDVWPAKLPVVTWDKHGLGADIRRIKQYVLEGAAETAYSIFIDEGGHFRKRNPYPGSKWIDWELKDAMLSKVSVHWSKAWIE